ncbi:MAG: BACON domain-containing protein [Candidatus Cryptobacteroides sp.]
MKKLNFLLGFAAMIAAVSCAEDVLSPEIHADTEAIAFDTEGGSQTVKVTVMDAASWTATTTGSWINIESNVDAGTIEVTVEPTRDIEDKTGEIIVYTDAETPARIAVTQEGNGIIYDRTSLKLMGIKGKVRSMDFWFDPMHMWEQQAGFFRNLQFNTEGMLTHFEFTFKQGVVVDFAVDAEYDDNNRITSAHFTTSDLYSQYFPSEYTIQFTYGNHGKYVCLENVFYPIETWNCLVYNRAWLPFAMKDLAEVRLVSDYLKGYQITEDGKGIDHVELVFCEEDNQEVAAVYPYSVKYRMYLPETDDDGNKTPNPGGTLYDLNHYAFTGNYTTRMKYDTPFVGIMIPVDVTFDLDQRTGLIYTHEVRNDEVFVGRPLLYKRFYADFRNSCFRYEDDLGTYYRMDISYNDNGDISALYNASRLASAKFDYTYDKYGNWVEMSIDTNTELSTDIKTSREIKYYR